MAMSIAPRVAGWGKRRPASSALSPAPPAPIGIPVADPSGPIGLTVEIYLGAVGWVDISPWTLYRDGSTQIQIQRGRPDEAARVQPQTASFQLNNSDGRFSPRNPLGPYYGLIGRNTQVRISRMQNGVRRFRFCGEVSAWPTTWDISGRDVWTTVTAAGQLRRLQQGTQTLGSAMRRAYALRESPTLTPVAYWPCEDGTTSNTIASGIAGTAAMAVSGSPRMASDTSFVCSLPLPVINGSTWYGAVPSLPAASWTDNVVRALLVVPAGVEPDGAVIMRMLTAGTVARADLVYRTGGSLQMIGYNAAGAMLFDTGAVGFGMDGSPRRISFELRTAGSSISYQIGTLSPGAGAALVSGGTLSSASVGAVTRVVVNPAGALGSSAIGHISVQPTADTLFDVAGPLQAWNGEANSTRYSRLCSEQGINVGNFFPVNSMGANAVTMGYQSSDTLANLLQQVVDTDLDIMFEAVDQIALVRRARLSLYNQATLYNRRAGLTLDYAQAQLSGPLDPLDDDAYTRNDITVERISGSSAVAVDADPLDPLSTLSPPQGVGDYTTTYSLSVGSDSDLADHAGWRLHLGTVDEPRYPTIRLNLRSEQFTSSIDLLNAALTLEIGDLVVINNSPAWLPPDPIRLIVQGYTETLGIYEHDMVLTCSPESPWRVAMLEDWTLSRADTDGSTLAAAIGPSDTAVQLATTDPTAPAWTTSAADYPIDVTVGGERITLVTIGTLLNANPVFASDISGWSAGGAGTTASWSQQHLFPDDGSGTLGAFATGAIRFVSPGAVASIDVHTDRTGAGTVTAGASYIAAGWCFVPGGTADIRTAVDWYDAGGTFISSGLGSAASAAQSTWTFLTQTLIAPALADSAVLRLRVGGTPSAGNVYYGWGLTFVPAASVSASTPQVFTAARSVNDIVKAHPAGEDVRLYQPMILSL